MHRHREDSKVIPLFEPVATCPECGCQHWFIEVDSLSDDYESITAFECVNCGLYIEARIWRSDAN